MSIDLNLEYEEIPEGAYRWFMGQWIKVVGKRVFAYRDGWVLTTIDYLDAIEDHKNPYRVGGRRIRSAKGE